MMVTRKRGKIKTGTVYLVILAAIAEELWLEYHTIGSDSRYNLYVGLLPTTAGCLFLLYYRWHFLVRNFLAFNGVFLKMFLIFFYGLQGLIFSYLSFGILAKTLWNYTNKIAADGQPAEQIGCPLLAFQQGKNSYIYYLFRGKKEKLNVRYKTLNPYEGADPDEYTIRFTVRSGIWDYSW
ncbi:MAG TPA: hypothetical protein VL092_00215 [Chitinophagaceae bacterium]|nr:hypothetical protein [Chitinophagaceae bacterium]